MMKIPLVILFIFVGGSSFAQDLEKEKKLSAEYLAQVSKEPGAQVLEKGVVLRALYDSGSQSHPDLSDTVNVTYHMVDREGKLIEESISADEILKFPLKRLIKCWQIALPAMPIGSFYKISCPSDTAYGDSGTSDGSIKGGAALTFRVTLFGVN